MSNIYNNTLYVTFQGSYLAKAGQTVEVRGEDQVLLKVPLHHLSGIVCFGRVGLSPDLLAAAAEAGIGLSIMTENGRLLARLVGPASGGPALRRAQYRLADDQVKTRDLARFFVAGKVANTRTVLLRGGREARTDEARQALSAAAQAVDSAVLTLQRAETADQVRGAEGAVSAAYFGVFDHLITRPESGFAFERRTRRPPRNPVNAMLSFGYAILLHDCSAALQSVGLDPAAGYLHADRPGRLSLALDLMEEFRPILVDRLVLSLINRQQVKPEEFTVQETGGVEMSETARKTFLVAYQERKKGELQHPFTEAKLTWGLVPYVQARLLARFIRGDLDAYPAFAWR